MFPLVAGALLLFALAVRVLARRAMGAGLSVDRWFWRAYVDAVRRDRRFPPTLPQYLLDEQQWYPPVFPWLLSRLPPHTFDRVEGWLGIALDLVRLSLLLLAAERFSGGDLRSVAFAGALYATVPILALYNVQLNPRALGALFLDVAALGVLRILPGEAALWPWIAVALGSGLILLTHKMTTQLLWFCCLCGGLGLGEWRLIAVVPASVVIAWVLSGGFYAKVLHGHADIVRFWNRNWRWLQADAVRESPVYGEPGYETPTKAHRRGWPGLLRHARGLLRNLPAAWVLLALGIRGETAWPRSQAEALLWGWLALELILSLATTLAPPLKCLGGGLLYLYNAAFPLALVWGLILSRPGGAGALPLAAYAIALGAQLGVVVLSLMLSARAARAGAAPDWERVVAFLREAPRGPVLCLPQSLYDELAYRTGQPVLFGAHGYGFERLEPLFPRLTLSVEELRQRHGLRYFLAREGTLNEKLLADLRAQAQEHEFGSYRLFGFS